MVADEGKPQGVRRQGGPPAAPTPPGPRVERDLTSEADQLVHCRNFPGIFGNQQQHYMEVIKRMLVQCMQDEENPQVSPPGATPWSSNPGPRSPTVLYVSRHFSPPTHLIQING